ncbi:MAG: hypothetical protein JNL83_16505 [Myxococcales bacterium]|nr:hypothetical protein [Myxococcales bacterium]
MQDVEYADIVDAGPPPRELTTTARRFVAGQAPYAWGVLVVIFVVLPNALMAKVLASGSAYVSLAVMIALAAAVFAHAAIKRKQLRAIIVTGEQRPAQIVGVERLDVRSGLARGSRDTLWFDVDGKRMKCASWGGDLDGATHGAWIRVLVHPQVPDRVVPVVSVT